MVTKIIGSNVLKFLSIHAYWICLFLGIGGIYAYIAGIKKGSKITIFSVIIYWVVAAICSVK